MTDSALQVVFMGSPEFAVPCLEAVAKHHQVLAVVSQPDRPSGRGRRLMPPAVKVAAEALGIEVRQPENMRRRSVREDLAALGADLFVVVAYGKILSARMLSVPPLGCVNVHASLLPGLRGAAPIQWSIINGEKRTGVTTMKMDAGMDTGPVLLQRSVDIRPGETAGSLHDSLAPLGAELLVETLAGLAAGTLRERPQPDEGVSMAPMLSKADGQIDWSLAAGEVDCRVRGLDPWPGAVTCFEGQRIKLFRSRLVEGQGGKPGEVLGADSRGLLVACGTDAVCLEDLQVAGRKRLPASAVLAGNPIPTGAVLSYVE